MLKTKVAAHPLTKEPLETGDEILTYATIKAQDFSIPMPPCKIDLLLNEGDVIQVGSQKLTVWPGRGGKKLGWRARGGTEDFTCLVDPSLRQIQTLYGGFVIIADPDIDGRCGQ